MSLLLARIKVNVKKSIEIQKWYALEKSSSFSNCLQVLFNEPSEIKCVEGIYKIKSEWIDHGWLIMNNQIIDLSFFDTQIIIPMYHPCIICTPKEASILLIKA